MINKYIAQSYSDFHASDMPTLAQQPLYPKPIRQHHTSAGLPVLPPVTMEIQMTPLVPGGVAKHKECHPKHSISWHMSIMPAPECCKHAAKHVCNGSESRRPVQALKQVNLHCGKTTVHGPGENETGAFHGGERSSDGWARLRRG